ncbi:lysylphosphatidylglycerol synthase transmembrane domain-containing protein [Candidatus Microthrix sp.]|uniref:lysylphosphatidylglycerol synthase transmembrane domain-containing protein n=1 Tax=Candidatus Neomicrothrix sp. TaxID=2719034 RepID=UPI0025913D98|nr:lysylphosphatidylglycerol synthase transmembrane domain-containing protein [Candidatus Microthrix sp.]HMS48082.1 lysylphosphatidylglycerol synthase transmembrane domain-containing protein [Candidatus Microthrix sp.]
MSGRSTCVTGSSQPLVDRSAAPPTTGSTLGRITTEDPYAPGGRPGHAGPGVEPLSPMRRALASTWLRVLLSAAMLGLLLWQLPDVSLNDLVPTWTAATPAWIALALGLQGAALSIQAVRWQRVLALFDQRLPMRHLLSMTWAGQFVSNVLPTAFGGDVVRIARSAPELDSVGTAFASITLERLTGWVVLPVISLVALAVHPSLLSAGTPTALALAIDVGTLIALASLLIAAGHSSVGRVATARVVADENPSGWRGLLFGVYRGVRAARTYPSRAATVIAAGAAFQLVLCAAVWAEGQIVGIEGLTLLAVLALFPPVAIAQNLPIGLGGLGVREGALVILLGALGTPDAQAIALGLVHYLATVAVSALGAPAFAAGYRPTKPGRADPETPLPE